MKMILATTEGGGFCLNSLPQSVLNEYVHKRFPHAVPYKYNFLHGMEYRRAAFDECLGYEGDFVWLTHDVGEHKAAHEIPNDEFVTLHDNARYDPVMVKAFEKYLDDTEDSEWAVIEVPDGYHAIVVDNGEGKENVFWSSTPIEGTEHPLNSCVIPPHAGLNRDTTSNEGVKATKQAVFDTIKVHTEACTQFARNCIAAAKLGDTVRVKATHHRHPGVRGKLVVETQLDIHEPVKVVFYPLTRSGELSLKPAFVSTELSTFAMLRPNFTQELKNIFEPCE